jgi:hypothetical protein
LWFCAPISHLCGSEFPSGRNGRSFALPRDTDLMRPQVDSLGAKTPFSDVSPKATLDCAERRSYSIPYNWTLPETYRKLVCAQD